MRPMKKNELHAYYKEAGDWSSDQRQAMATSRKVAWIVAIVAVAIALVEAFALVLLTPLKTSVPYTLLVDRQTGYVQALDPIKTDKISPDKALTQSLLVQYVLARENFDFGTIRDSYRKVWLWSAEKARNDYVTAMQANNPASPLVTVPRGTTFETQIRSISPLANGTMLVRFERVRRDRTRSVQERRLWVAVISYRFSDKPLSMDVRFVNPLGFEVMDYRRSPEAPPLEVDAAPNLEQGANGETKDIGMPNSGDGSFQ